MRLKEAIHARIKELCSDRDLTLHGLSCATGITQSTLSNIMSGRNNSATIATIKKLCDGLGMELPDFFNSDLFRNIEQEIM